MPNEITIVIGIIRSLPEDSEYSVDSSDSDRYCIDLTVLDGETRLVPLRFAFPSNTMARVFLKALDVGALVRVAIRGGLGDRRSFYRAETLAFLSTKDLLEPFGFADDGPAADDPFSPVEQPALKAALEQAKAEIKSRFRPDAAAMLSIENRLNELGEKVVALSKLNWAKLFVSCLIGISVDLGFGTTVPQTLINVFKTIFAGTLSQKLLPSGVD